MAGFDFASSRMNQSMHKLTQLFSGIFLVLVFIASITFSYFNTTPVAIAFASWQFREQPVSVWIIGAFVSGGLLGLLLGLGLFRNMKSRSEIRRLTRQLEQARQEVAELRATPRKDY